MYKALHVNCGQMVKAFQRFQVLVPPVAFSVKYFITLCFLGRPVSGAGKVWNVDKYVYQGVHCTSNMKIHISN